MKDFWDVCWDGFKGSGTGAPAADVGGCVVVGFDNNWTYICPSQDPRLSLLCVHDVTMKTSQEKQTQTVQKVASTTGGANMVFDW